MTTRASLFCDGCPHAKVRHVWKYPYGLCCRDCACTAPYSGVKQWELTESIRFALWCSCDGRSASEEWTCEVHGPCRNLHDES